MLFALPSEQHGQLSVLNNKLNAVAKNLWRAIRQNVDYAYDAVLLLRCLDEVKQTSITKWLEENFLLKEKELTIERGRSHLSKNKKHQILRESKKDHYVETYNEWSS